MLIEKYIVQCETERKKQVAVNDRQNQARGKQVMHTNYFRNLFRTQLFVWYLFCLFACSQYIMIHIDTNK